MYLTANLYVHVLFIKIKLMMLFVVDTARELLIVMIDKVICGHTWSPCFHVLTFIVDHRHYFFSCYKASFQFIASSISTLANKYNSEIPQRNTETPLREREIKSVLCCVELDTLFHNLMGNHRFKLSDMIPNAWFYKLKDMSRSRKQKGSHAVKNKASSPVMSQRSPPNCLHYFPTEPYKAGMLFNSPIQTKVTDVSFTVSPRRSSKRRAQRKTIYKPSPSVLSSVSTACNCHWTHQPNQAESLDFYASSIESSSSELDLYECITSESDECDSLAAPHMLNGLSPDCSCRVSSSTNDIIIDMNNESFAVNPEKLDGFDAISKLGLPPIVTKPVRFDDQVIEAHYLEYSSKVEESSRTTTPKSSGNSRGIKLRVNSAKLASRKLQACARRSISSSSSSACKVSRNTTGFPQGFAVVKSSIDPKRDFKESMVEMIRENNIWSSEDLEDLLACYLSLNSREYHELIIKAFEQTWFDLAQLRM